MLSEFCSLTGSEESKFKENWEKYEKLVFKYAPLEQKKSVRTLLNQYNAEECENAGMWYFKWCVYTTNIPLIMCQAIDNHWGQGIVHSSIIFLYYI